MTLDFLPPRESRLILRCSHVLLPVVMSRFRHIVAVSIPEVDWSHLAVLRCQRAILSANHPTTSDPLVAMELSRRLGEGFNYMACRELFHGPWGWIIQRLGAYSIHRGMPDRQSLRMTRHLLADLDRKVVIFPEGETYEHNDALIPFQQGVIQIGFGALEEIRKAGREPSLPVLPIAVKYRCVVDPRPAIDGGLRSLEKALSLPPVEESAYTCLRRVGVHVLGRMPRSTTGSPRRRRTCWITWRGKSASSDRVTCRWPIRCGSCSTPCTSSRTSSPRSQAITGSGSTPDGWPRPRRCWRICAACRTSWWSRMATWRSA